MFSIFAMLKYKSLGSSSARTLHGLFLCPYDKAVQPRATVIMAVASPVMCFSNGKWAAVFHAPLLKYITL